ncbi:MAG: hypothetical protein K8S00_07475, partial [Bacteroidales bacterium]|nr:hypothetical protein [Bacteroidales bacterium]
MFNPNRLFRIALYIIIFIILNSADCSKPDSEPTCYISEEFKSYVIFNEGSYWIYQNQFNIIDTIKVIKTEHSILDGPYTHPFELYNISTISSLIGDTKFKAKCWDMNYVDCTNFNVYSPDYIYSILFFCCCAEGKKYENLTYLHQLDSIEVDSTVFYNIKVFESDSINPQTARRSYYSQNIGLI